MLVLATMKPVSKLLYKWPKTTVRTSIGWNKSKEVGKRSDLTRLKYLSFLLQLPFLSKHTSDNTFRREVSMKILHLIDISTLMSKMKRNSRLSKFIVKNHQLALYTRT